MMPNKVQSLVGRIAAYSVSINELLRPAYTANFLQEGDEVELTIVRDEDDKCIYKKKVSLEPGEIPTTSGRPQPDYGVVLTNVIKLSNDIIDISDNIMNGNGEKSLVEILTELGLYECNMHLKSA